MRGDYYDISLFQFKTKCWFVYLYKRIH